MQICWKIKESKIKVRIVGREFPVTKTISGFTTKANKAE